MVCSHNISIAKQTYSATCGVESETVVIGNKAKFTANQFSPNNKNVTIELRQGSNTVETANTFWLGNTFTKEYPMNSLGSYTFSLYIEGDSVCAKIVNVVEAAPTFSCDQITVNPSEVNNVTITLKDVTGCTNGCRFTIQEAGVYGDYSTTGDLATFSGTGSAGEVIGYNVTLTNGTGNATKSTTKQCYVKYRGDAGDLSTSVTKKKDASQIERSGYADRAMDTLKVGEVVALDKQTDKISIGCWDGGFKQIKVQDCHGNISTREFYCTEWKDLQISEKCTIYVKADTEIIYKFGAW